MKNLKIIIITLFSITILVKFSSWANPNFLKFRQDSNYKAIYQTQYKSIKYLELTNFVKNVNYLLDQNYNPTEINYIFTYLSTQNQKKLLHSPYLKLKPYYHIKNFNVANYERYQKYQSLNSHLNYDDIVTHVNLDLDVPDYELMHQVTNPDDLLVVVNKHNQLPLDYVPTDLVAVNPQNTYGTTVRKVVVTDLQAFLEAAARDGHPLYQTTSYRSSGLQKTLYNNYVTQEGVAKADTYSARPGNSEHQTGLAIDLANSKLKGTGRRLNKDDEEWIKENCYKYGFILRFTAEKQLITGYMSEEWHIRYVGKKAAQFMDEHNLALEEYVDKYIKVY